MDYPGVSPAFPSNAKYRLPVPQSSLSGIFLSLHGSEQVYGVLPACLKLLQIHNTSHRQTLPRHLLLLTPAYLFSLSAYESSYDSPPHPKWILQ